jgi:hypothetical protein
MGTSSSPAELAGKLAGLAKDMADTRRPLNAAALAAKGVFIASAAGAVGRRPQGKRKVIGARYDIKGNGPHATAVVYYTGAAHLLLNPTRPHRIEPRRPRGSRTRRRRGATALTIGANVRAWANHPGTAGKDPGARRAKAAAAKVVPKVFARAGLIEPLRRNF